LYLLKEEKMPENQKKILEMLSEKKITIEEAEKLLSLTGTGETGEDSGIKTGTIRKVTGKYMRVLVEPDEGDQKGERVNIRVPMNLLRAGMKFTALIPPHAADKVNEAMKEKGIDFDLRNFKPDDVEELMEALSDLEVNVEGGQGKVRIYVE